MGELFMSKGNDGEHLNRALKPRHLNMIAIGGAIGTGLFVASGSSISGAGPGGALLAYAVIGTMVFFLMTSLGEMATYMPVSGSFETYATRFVDPTLGFALGWNYWYNWAITVASEMVAGAIVMGYWFPNIHGAIWSILFLALLFGLNILGARGYGEAEFWFAGIKVVTIVVFLIIGVLMILGIMKGGPEGGHLFDNWVNGDAPFHGGFLAIFGITMAAGYSFQGTEIVGVAAGETENPGVAVPKAIKTVFWRILIFYIGALTVIGFILPYTDPNLLSGATDNIAMSPFVLVLRRTGFAAAASVMNAVILTSVLSCGNSGLYTSSRMLYALSKEGKAPSFLSKLSSRGVPINCLYFTAGFALLCFVLYLTGGENGVYLWLVNGSGMAGFIAWLGIAISHYRFRKAWVAQGHSPHEFKYHAALYPFGPIFAFLLCAIVILFQDYQDILAGNWMSAFGMYLGIFVFLAFFIPYKVIKKTKIVPLKDCDFSTDNITGMDDIVSEIDKERK